MRPLFPFPRPGATSARRRHKQDSEPHFLDIYRDDTNCQIMARRVLDRVECIACEKRVKPDKHHVYTLSVAWNDGVKYAIYRKYSAFTDLHNDLLKALQKFPTLPVPEPPAEQRGYLLRTETKQKERNEKRKKKIEKYCEELLCLPNVDRVRDTLHSFFTAWPSDHQEPEDLPTTPPTPSPPKSPRLVELIRRPISSMMKPPWRRGTTHGAHTGHKKTNSDPNLIYEMMYGRGSRSGSLTGSPGSGVPGGGVSSQPGSRSGSREELVPARPPKRTGAVGEMYESLAKFSMTEQFSVDKGDTVILKQTNDDGWWLVEKTLDKKVGWIPSHVVISNSEKKKGLRKQNSLRLLESRMSCSCPDINADEKRKMTRKSVVSTYMPGRSKRSSDDSTHSPHTCRQALRPRSHTSQGNPDDGLYETIPIQAPPNLPDRRRQIIIPDEPDPDYQTFDDNGESGYASLKHKASSRLSDDEEEDPYSYTTDDRPSRFASRKDANDTDPYETYDYTTDRLGRSDTERDTDPYSMTYEKNGRVGRSDSRKDTDPYSMPDDDRVSRTGSRKDTGLYDTIDDRPRAQSELYASIDRPRNRSSPYYDITQSSSDYEPVGKRHSDADVIYAEVNKPKITLTVDSIGNSLEDLDDMDAPPALPNRRYSFSDIYRLLGEDKNSQKEKDSLKAPLQEKRTRSANTLDDAENIYEPIFPHSRTGSKSSRCSFQDTKPRALSNRHRVEPELPEFVLEELRRVNCYYGPMSSKTVATTLDNYGTNGDFLIIPILSKTGELCISMKDGTNIRNFAIKCLAPSRYHFANHDFLSIGEIIQHYRDRPICESKVDTRPLMLESAICREKNAVGEETITFHTAL